jgi:hypothetical protein
MNYWRFFYIFYIFSPISTKNLQKTHKQSGKNQRLSPPVTIKKQKKVNGWDQQLALRKKNYCRWGVSVCGFGDYIGFLNYDVDPMENLLIIIKNLYKKKTLGNKTIVMEQGWLLLNHEEQKAMDKSLRNKTLDDNEKLLMEKFYVPLKHFFLMLGIQYRMPLGHWFWENNCFLGNGIVGKSLIARGFQWSGFHWEWLVGLVFMGNYPMYQKKFLENYHYNGYNKPTSHYLYPVNKINNEYQYLINGLIGIRLMMDILPDFIFLRHRFLSLELGLLINNHQWLINIQLNTIGKYQLQKNKLSATML